MNVNRKTQRKQGAAKASQAKSRIVEHPPNSEPTQTEEKLRENEERYRLISEDVSDYVFSTRVEDDGALRLNWVAGAFEAITGYTFEEYSAQGCLPPAHHPTSLATPSPPPH